MTPVLALVSQTINSKDNKLVGFAIAALVSMSEGMEADDEDNDNNDNGLGGGTAGGGGSGGGASSSGASSSGEIARRIVEEGAVIPLVGTKTQTKTQKKATQEQRLHWLWSHSTLERNMEQRSKPPAPCMASATLQHAFLVSPY